MKNFLRLQFSEIILIKPFISAILLLSASLLYAQSGAIKGKITDVNSNEPLIGASVLIKGTAVGAASDFDGNYAINNLKPGVYSIVVSYISYKQQTKENILVESGKETMIDISLESANISLNEVEVVAKSNRESENILLMEQKQSLLATQAVGAREMSRKGISDAEAAVAQVSGISKQEGVKNVFVRGLGDRYNFTTLNGLPIPSEDPLYKNISLDFFGSDLIKNIGVNKVFTSNNYGDVGGAVIDVSSKELIGEKELDMDLSTGINTKAIGSDFIKMDGVNYWGASKSVQPLNNYKTVYNYGNSLDPHSVSLPLNYSYGISGGKKLYLGENKNPLSFLLVGTYSTKYSYTKEKVYDTTTDGTVIDDLNGNKSTQNINQMVLGNINFLLNNKQEFNYNIVIIHDNNQYIGNFVGYGPKYLSSLQPSEYEYNGFMRRQQSNDNLLITNQLLSKLKINNKLKLDAGISYNSTIGSEPDRRVNKLFRISETEYSPLAGDGANIRNFNKLTENDLNAKFDFTYKLSEKFKDDLSSINFGYNGRYLTDDFSGNEYSMIITTLSGKQTLDNLKFDELFNQQNYDNKEFAGYARISTYKVTKLINAGFVGLNYQFSNKFTSNIGLRTDQIYIPYDFNVQGGYNGANSGTKNYLFVLPELNLKYSINDRNALRLGMSKTYTLPQTIEMMPYQYLGLSYSFQGNPKLKPSENYNVDVKWDFYLSPSELLSLNAFYKYIDKPITRVYQNNGAGYYTFDNMQYASVAGVEIEVRKNIINKTSSNGTNKLSAGVNASYINSSMFVNSTASVSRYAQLEGSSPYLANIDLSHNYSNKDFSIVNTLVFKYFSDRIFSLGFVGYNDVIEKGIPTLDFVSGININKHLGIKLKAKNILDPEYKLMRKATTSNENQVLHSYKKGMDLSLGITYQF
ncbi:conserved hypothetical protein [uncultured Paludibacter sp.]|nr:conserved hypothetical protein [uncultured Paludibacter sp.]